MFDGPVSDEFDENAPQPVLNRYSNSQLSTFSEIFQAQQLKHKAYANKLLCKLSATERQLFPLYRKEMTQLIDRTKLTLQLIAQEDNYGTPSPTKKRAK